MNRKPKTVLIVEDSVSAIAGYLLVLETLEIDITPFLASSLSQAVQILKTERVDLVILDLVLPDACGSEVIEGVRALNPGVPILLVTGYPEKFDTTSLEPYRVGGFFAKPFRVEAFGGAVGRFLAPRAGRCCAS
jgi:two-component system response regulator HydG